MLITPTPERLKHFTQEATAEAVCRLPYIQRRREKVNDYFLFEVIKRGLILEKIIIDYIKSLCSMYNTELIVRNNDCKTALYYDFAIKKNDIIKYFDIAGRGFSGSFITEPKIKARQKCDYYVLAELIEWREAKIYAVIKKEDLERFVDVKSIDYELDKVMKPSILYNFSKGEFVGKLSLFY
ncbi:MAG: hypothetical protein ACK4NC_07295 [Candidatus Gracilibacteria bacterium]